jgi:hypothetical protein
VWFPTVSSENEQHEVLAAKPGANVPVWAKLELELRRQGIDSRPVPVVDDGGALVDEARAVLQTIARNEMPGSSRAPAPWARSAVLSTDLGQVFNPPVEDGLPLMADRFLEAGFTDDEIRVMAVDNTRRVAGA